jgi:APA family basic amino acid/polyamine antiporter
LSVPLAGFKLDLIKIISIGVIYVFTHLNIRGVQAGSFGQNILTFGSMSVLVLFIIFGFISHKGDWQNFVPFVSMDISLDHLSKFGVALVGVYFTYSGWTILAYVAGEIKRPSRSIPYATGWGVLTVLLLYLLINVVYILAFPPSQMQNIVDIGHVVFTTLWSEQLSEVFIIMIMIAVLSTLNATILSGARIYYAMSKNKRLFRWFGEIHSQYQSPANALKFQFFWTILLILSGSFNQLLTYTVFIMVVFGFLSGLSIFILRKKKEDRQGIYLAWGYPFTPIIYIIITGWIMVNTLRNQTLESAIGLILVAAGLPFYYYFSRKHRKN